MRISDWSSDVCSSDLYGVVGLIVKMDDIGLHMAQGGSRARQAIGRGLVALMPRLLAGLATLGTAAMLWVGGQIFLHGLDAFHKIGRASCRERVCQYV